MKIVVCIKQVPSTTKVSIDPQTHNLKRSNLPGRMNPVDKVAVEVALQLREKHGGSITVISMGPNENKKSIREALAMGADSGILLSSRAFAGSDTLATGYVLAKAIEKLGQVELVLFGKQSVDADTGQVGPITAELLDYPQMKSHSFLYQLKNRKFHQYLFLQECSKSRLNQH